MGSIDVNPYALMFSMKTVNRWTDNVNANLLGSAKTAYKSMDIYFGGGLNTVTYRPGTNERLGINGAENSINVDHTTISFKQGDIVQSTIKTHIAIQGEGFFVVQDASTGNKLFTRNGEFHVDTNGFVRTQEGLFVLNTDNTMAKVSSADGESIDSLDPFHVPAIAAGSKLAIATFADLQALKFNNKFGSQYYDSSTYAVPTILDYDDNALSASTTLYSKKLEASNVNQAKQITELSVSKNLFEALTKQFLVYLNNVDTALSMIR